jgi:hypothetical protein
MSFARPFAYNTGSTISGTEQIGSLAIGIDNLNYPDGVGGVRWWNGPDETLGYVICVPNSDGNQPNPDNQQAFIGFYRSESLTENSFVSLTNSIFNQSFTTGNQCKDYLNSNGYWTSWILTTPTPTPTTTQTITPTQTPTQTITPTQTQTPTPTSAGGAVTFSRTFTSGQSPGTTIENAWTTFRGQLTGTYTKFDFTSSNGQGYTGITDAVKVQQLADGLRNGTPISVVISGVTWLVGCCACRQGGSLPQAVEFSNVGSCNAGSTAALRPFINNNNWGGIGSTVGAATQTLTLKFY